MRFALMIEAQQGLTYDDQLAIARRAEAAGFETLLRSDHYESFPGEAGRTATDAWAVLAGLARETERIGLGVLVSPATFRHPGNLAKVVATVDWMSGGRLEVGVGAGWNESEHLRHGFSFPPIHVRAELLEETLEILHGLWSGPDGWSFEGRHYQVRDALFRPRPVPVAGRPSGFAGPRPRIIVGGTGSPRSMRIAARWADEFNITSAGPEQVAAKVARLTTTLEEAGRAPGSMTRSTMVGVLVGADRTEVAGRERRLLEVLGAEEAGEAWLAERRRRWIMGTPDEARAAAERFAVAGAERIMLQDFLPWDLDMIDLLGAELVGRV